MGLEKGVAALKRMVAPGVLGFYTHVEVTEVVAFVARGTPPVNVLTLMVAEARVEKPSDEVTFLNASPILLRDLRDWQFGICRYVLPIDDAVGKLECLEKEGSWAPSGKPLSLGPLTAGMPQFVPPDQAFPLPLNRILKNNFWNGSYVAEWADLSKARFKPFFDDPRLLQVLSEAVSKVLPLHLASLSDRLGDVVFQLPVTVVMASFHGMRDDGFKVNVAWHENATPRPLHATVSVAFDGIVAGHFTREVSEGTTVLPAPTHPGQYRAYVWDDQYELVLAATGEAGFINSVHFGTHAIDPEPRTFKLKAEDGSLVEQRVALQRSMRSHVAAPGVGPREDWTRKRMYRDETSRLVKERRFVQYRPAPHAKRAEHQKALDDIRQLVATHGTEGAWLWDPYLSADDLLKTLFFCPHAGAELRGLTSMEDLPECGQLAKPTDAFFTRQRQTFAAAKGNHYGLRLEYRARSGMAGWAFHDRFLIFPRAEEAALAWSLGTSVNSLGRAHHILQRVDDGQQVSDAFVDLWDSLSAPEHLIWKAGAL
ncbi:VPA1262 family N-terminal domain-containing protein [Xanthomonas sp. NCPPB 2632]|uniref:VPA1262 family N-terminal domain-containing protein n=1 Tax=Xanthomonas sp. NCPPB 2632 TaxID=3240912 RepID=UPI0035164255